MGGKGNCYDNSAVESFFKSLKAELVWRRHWQTRRKVEVALVEHINGFYNPRSKLSALGWKSTVAFKQRAAYHEHLTGTVRHRSNRSINLAPQILSPCQGGHLVLLGRTSDCHPPLPNADPVVLRAIPF